MTPPRQASHKLCAERRGARAAGSNQNNILSPRCSSMLRSMHLMQSHARVIHGCKRAAVSGAGFVDWVQKLGVKCSSIPRPWMVVQLGSFGPSSPMDDELLSTDFWAIRCATNGRPPPPRAPRRFLHRPSPSEPPPLSPPPAVKGGYRLICRNMFWAPVERRR